MPWRLTGHTRRRPTTTATMAAEGADITITVVTLGIPGGAMPESRVNAPRDASVDELKALLVDGGVVEVPVGSSLNLMHAGSTLASDDSLHVCGIVNDSKVFAVLRRASTGAPPGPSDAVIKTLTGDTIVAREVDLHAPISTVKGKVLAASHRALHIDEAQDVGVVVVGGSDAAAVVQLRLFHESGTVAEVKAAAVEANAELAALGADGLDVRGIRDTRTAAEAASAAEGTIAERADLDVVASLTLTLSESPALPDWAPLSLVRAMFAQPSMHDGAPLLVVAPRSAATAEGTRTTSEAAAAAATALTAALDVGLPIAAHDVAPDVPTLGAFARDHPLVEEKLAEAVAYRGHATADCECETSLCACSQCPWTLRVCLCVCCTVRCRACLTSLRLMCAAVLRLPLCVAAPHCDCDATCIAE